MGDILGVIPVAEDAIDNGENFCLEAFNDVRNNRYALSNKAYTLKIDGVTKSAITGGIGVVSITTLDGTTATLDARITSPVPEPETYAMLLAGLGLMGAVARRRSKKS